MLVRLAARLRAVEVGMEQDQVPYLIITMLFVIIIIMTVTSGKRASTNIFTKIIISRSSERLDQT